MSQKSDSTVRALSCTPVGRVRTVAIDASDLLGSVQLAAVKVNPRGMAQRVSRNVTPGPIGAVSSKIVFHGSQQADVSQTPFFGRNGLLAVTAEELVLIKLKSGLVTLKPDIVVARVPRADVVSAEISGGGVAPGLTVSLRTGVTWFVEFTRPSKRHAESVVDDLSGAR
jgi:hypothetical protein